MSAMSVDVFVSLLDVLKGFRKNMMVLSVVTGAICAPRGAREHARASESGRAWRAADALERKPPFASTSARIHLRYGSST